jgi:hypothetical protein
VSLAAPFSGATSGCHGRLLLLGPARRLYLRRPPQHGLGPAGARSHPLILLTRFLSLDMTRPRVCSACTRHTPIAPDEQMHACRRARKEWPTCWLSNSLFPVLSHTLTRTRSHLNLVSRSLTHFRLFFGEFIHKKQCSNGAVSRAYASQLPLKSFPSQVHGHRRVLL